MKKYKVREIIQQAEILSANMISVHSIDNAVRIVKLTLDKIRAQKKCLTKKYGE